MARPRLVGVVVVPWLLVGLSGCPAPIEQGCLADVLVGEDADEEDVARELALIPCIDGDLIVDNTLVRSLSLPSLVEIGGSLGVSLNVALTEIELPALERVGGLLDISANPVLERVSLPSLEEVGGDVRVVDNPDLPPSEAARVAAGAEVGGEIILEGNTGEEGS